MNRWINKLAQAARGTLSLAMGVATFYLACLGTGAFGAGILLMWLFIWLSLILHELGHVAGARIYGMTVWRVNISGLEFHAQHRGWRVRLAGFPYRRVGGFVQAFPLFGRPVRPQIISLTLGGPLGNLAVAIFCGACGWLLLPERAAFLSLSFAAANLGSALINLVPHEGTLPSDGLTFIRLLRGIDEQTPGHVHARLISRSIAGQTADQLPESEISMLEQQPAPIQLIALWYRLKADQNRGDWASVDSRRTELAALELTLVPTQKAALSDLSATLRAEFAFSHAMLTEDGDDLAKDALPTKLAAALPWLQPRCDALIAALQGDKARCTELLKISQHHAEKSIDKALWSSEAVLRGYITAAIIERGQAEQ
jgi:hypothetical protein